MRVSQCSESWFCSLGLGLLEIVRKAVPFQELHAGNKHPTAGVQQSMAGWRTCCVAWPVGSLLALLAAPLGLAPQT